MNPGWTGNYYDVDDAFEEMVRLVVPSTIAELKESSSLIIITIITISGQGTTVVTEVTLEQTQID